MGDTTTNNRGDSDPVGERVVHDKIRQIARKLSDIQDMLESVKDDFTKICIAYDEEKRDG